MAKDMYQEVGERIATMRRELRLTQEQLAERAGFATSYVARIEGGKRKPTLETVATIAKALDVPLAELVDPAASSAGRPRRLVAELAAAAQLLGPVDIKLLTKLAGRLARSSRGR